jgi:MOSC domain-containing protein YiiM
LQGVVVQVNLSRGGLPKRPVPEAFLTLLGFEGDAVAHPKFHGGPLKAVLLVTSEGIDELIAAGYPLFSGAMGENLTVRGLDRRALGPGTRLTAGDAVVELTTLRIPCSNLDGYGPSIKAAVYEEGMTPQDPRWGLGGFYTAVLKTGLVRAGDAVRVITRL